MRDERRLDSGRASPPASEEPKQELNKERDADRLQRAGAPGHQAAPASPAPGESRAKSRDSAEGQSGALAPAPPASAPPALAAKRQSAISSVSGRLNVKDRPSAEKGLAELLSRVGGSETGRRQELGGTVVEVLVPEGRYPDFVSGLATLGVWLPEDQPTVLPTDPPQLRFSIRIAD
jgi:hypothetical protein